MGNVLGHQHGVPPQGGHGQQRNPNQSRGHDVLGYVLQGIIPTLGIYLFATTLQVHKQRVKALEDEVTETGKKGTFTMKFGDHFKTALGVKVFQDTDIKKVEEECEKKLNQVIDQFYHEFEEEKRALKESCDNTLTEKKQEHFAIVTCLEQERDDILKVGKEFLASLEQEDDDNKYQQNLDDIGAIDFALKTILDIGCSRIQPKIEREWKQKYLLKKVAKMSIWPGSGNEIRGNLEMIYEDDRRRFCGKNKNENGKFRPLYVAHWRSKAQVQRFKNIAEVLKTRLSEFEQSQKLRYPIKTVEKPIEKPYLGRRLLGYLKSEIQNFREFWNLK